MGAGAVIAAAAVRRREENLLDAFRAAGATSPDRAQSFEAIGVDDSLAIRRLRERAVIREAVPGVFYLDEEVWTAVRRTRHRLVAVFLAILVIVLLGVWMGIIKG